MHNCKRTRTALIDLAFDEMPDAQARELLAELNDCQSCQTEHAGVTSALRMSREALRTSSPADEFWQGYHARLEQRLKTANHAPEMTVTENLSLPAWLWSSTCQLAASSVRVPVPAALSVLLVVGILSFAALTHSQAPVAQTVPQVTVETPTVQVPVIQERLITKVVYVEKKQRIRSAASPDYTNPNIAYIAVSRPVDGGRKQFSLVGFKPTEQVNLTIIKGNDEK